MLDAAQKAEAKAITEKAKEALRVKSDHIVKTHENNIEQLEADIARLQRKLMDEKQSRWDEKTRFNNARIFGLQWYR